MQPEQLNALLPQLIAGWENEVVEFKNVGDSYSTSDIGKYFSALSNEANLRNQDCGWLIFGVNNKSRSVVGSAYRMCFNPRNVRHTITRYYSKRSNDHDNHLHCSYHALYYPLYG